MCGIAGATKNMLGPNPDKTLEKMNKVMVHRGPDMGGIYLNDDFGLCHRRLSIIDLSVDGLQPMHSRCGRYTIVFNGEIYNYVKLRKDLMNKSYTFKSNSDTEVLLALYAEYGRKFLSLLRGMFSIAIWDNKKKELFAARDRIGKKPFYYYHDNKKFVFASEIKSILSAENINNTIDNTAIVDYFSYLYIPHPKTIYKNIKKLPPGHYMVFSYNSIQVKEYWDIDFSRPHTGTYENIKEELYNVIYDSVKSRLISDVPLGAFLSGGIDSSGIVALMASIMDNSVKTCSIGFDDIKHNEANYAKEFAESLGAEHKEHYIKNEPSKIIEKLVWHFDEPFADASMVPTYYVSKMAKRNVAVVLSGDGGDENFAGYDKYNIDNIERYVRKCVPTFLTSILCRCTEGYESIGTVRKINSLCRSSLSSPGEALFITNAFTKNVMMNRLFRRSFKNKINEYDPAGHTVKYYQRAQSDDHLSKILYADLKLFLPGDILVKVDRMSMANALEVRSPLLDHKVIEFAAQIPSKYKLKRGNKKAVLKDVFSPLIGKEIINRPKHGFTVPLDEWFRNELKEISYNKIIQSEKLNYFISPKNILSLWELHQSRKTDYGTILWLIFIFTIWLENNEF